jgi:hypothetical protein
MTAGTRTRAWGVAFAVGIALLGACGGDDDDAKAASTTSNSTTVSEPSTTSGTDPTTDRGHTSGSGDCPVDDAAVKTATGADRVTVGAPHGGYPGATTCAWYLGDQAGGHTISVTVLHGGKSAFAATAHAPNGPDELNDGSPYESVDGLGDQASASGVGGDVNLDVIAGDDWVNVTSFDFPGADPSRATAKGLSTDALDACTKLARSTVGGL